MDEKYLLEIKTVQSTTFKQVIDAMKEILIDINLEFDESGMQVVAMDSTRVVLVHLKLDADKFESYYCPKKLYVGVNMIKLQVLIKTVTNGNTLTLYITESNPNHLGIRIENPEKNVRTNYNLSIMDVDVLSIPPIAMDFETVINMSSVDFQKIVRDMTNLADYIEISNIENQLTFKCDGDFCSQETTISVDNNDHINITKNGSRGQHEIIQGIFSLKYLSLFTKCTNLSSMVEIYIKNNYPLVLCYNVTSLGSIRLCLAGRKNTDA